MRLLLGSLFALVVAAAVGLGATYLALTRGAAFGALTIGSWTAWPKTGTVDADPYARASIARTGRLPTALGDGVAFTAATDDNGRPLDGRCDVVLAGVTPAARFWTLTLYNRDGRTGGQFGQSLRLHQPGNRPPRRRQFRDRRGAARQSRQLAADRRRRTLRRWCCAFTIRRSASRPKPAAKCRCRRSNAGAAHDPLAAPAVRRRACSAASCIWRRSSSCRAPPRRTPIRGSRRIAPVNTVDARCRRRRPESALMPFMDPAFASAVCRYLLRADVL